MELEMLIYFFEILKILLEGLLVSFSGNDGVVAALQKIWRDDSYMIHARAKGERDPIGKSRAVPLEIDGVNQSSIYCKSLVIDRY